MLTDILNVAVFSVISIILMMVGIWLVDLAIPCHFPTEIKKKNEAVGFLTAGIAIAVGILIKAAVMSAPAVSDEKLLQGIVSTLIYFAIGIVVCIIGYIILNIVNKQYDLNKEIGEGNKAAGIMVCGLFIGLAIAISGVIC